MAENLAEWFQNEHANEAISSPNSIQSLETEARSVALGVMHGMRDFKETKARFLAELTETLGGDVARAKEITEATAKEALRMARNNELGGGR